MTFHETICNSSRFPDLIEMFILSIRELPLERNILTFQKTTTASKQWNCHDSKKQQQFVGHLFNLISFACVYLFIIYNVSLERILPFKYVHIWLYFTVHSIKTRAMFMYQQHTAHQFAYAEKERIHSAHSFYVGIDDVRKIHLISIFKVAETVKLDFSLSRRIVSYRIVSCRTVPYEHWTQLHNSKFTGNHITL